MQQRTINRSAKSVNYTLPSPIGGLNARDSLDLMSETDAVVMDNYLPLDTKVALRRGYVRYAALDGKVRTLAEYKLPDENRFLAFAGSTVYNISSKAAIKDYKKDFGEGRWQY